MLRNPTIDLFSLYVLFYQYRSRDNTLENCFFQISFCSRAYVRIIYEKRKGQVPLEPLLGKQNIQAKEVYWKISELFTCPSEAAGVAPRVPREYITYPLVPGK